MDVTTMTVRVPKDLLERARQYARENDTTLTRLITIYFERLVTNDDPERHAPIVKRLSGTLSREMNVKDHHQHLEDKYR